MDALGNTKTGTFTSMDTYRGNAYDPASLHRYTYAQNNPQMYNDPSGHFIGFIGMQVNTACSAIVRNRHAIHVMGMVNGMMNSIVNRMLGGEQNDVDAFITGYIAGAGMAAAYIGAAAIGVLYQLKVFLTLASVAGAVMECAASIVLAIGYAVTGNHKQALFYTALAVICIIDIIVELGTKGSVTAEGPKGTATFDVDVTDGTALKDIIGTSYDIKKLKKTQSDMNTSRSEVNSIVEYIAENGPNAVDPIRVRVHEGVAYIEDGHHRYEAFMKLGYGRVPIKYLHKSNLGKLLLNGTWIRTLDEILEGAKLCE